MKLASVAFLFTFGQVIVSVSAQLGARFLGEDAIAFDLTNKTFDDLKVFYDENIAYILQILSTVTYPALESQGQAPGPPFDTPAGLVGYLASTQGAQMLANFELAQYRSGTFCTTVALGTTSIPLGVCSGGASLTGGYSDLVCDVQEAFNNFWEEDKSYDGYLAKGVAGEFVIIRGPGDVMLDFELVSFLSGSSGDNPPTPVATVAALATIIDIGFPAAIGELPKLAGGRSGWENPLWTASYQFLGTEFVEQADGSTIQCQRCCTEPSPYFIGDEKRIVFGDGLAEMVETMEVDPDAFYVSYTLNALSIAVREKVHGYTGNECERYDTVPDHDRFDSAIQGYFAGHKKGLGFKKDSYKLCQLAQAELEREKLANIEKFDESACALIWGANFAQKKKDVDMTELYMAFNEVDNFLLDGGACPIPKGCAGPGEGKGKKGKKGNL